MAYFIQLTRATSREDSVWINFEQVFAVHGLGERNTAIVCTGGDGASGSHTISVRESIAEIMVQVPAKMKEGGQEL
jgi:hypothetical protein